MSKLKQARQPPSPLPRTWKSKATLVLMLATVVQGHMTMVYPLTRGHPSNPNTAVIDYDCRDSPLFDGVHGCPKTYPCGGYPPDRVVTQRFRAGQVIPVRFSNAQFGQPSQPQLTPSSNQARHGGGLCEFSLSYDAGKTFGVIARYHASCPDLAYDWPVRIPSSAPVCDTPGKCLFAWSWINALGNDEFYMACADILIEKGNGSDDEGDNNNNKDWNPAPIQLANMPGFPTWHPQGDGNGNMQGPGPSAKDLEDNQRGVLPGPEPFQQDQQQQRRRRRRRQHSI